MSPQQTATASIRFGRTAPGVAVRDLDAALVFYRDVLGMTVTFTNGDPVGFAIVERDDAEIHLSTLPTHTPSAVNALHLIVDDVDGLFEHVRAAGVRIVKGVRDEEFGMRAFVMADPDGNRIDVATPFS